MPNTYIKEFTFIEADTQIYIMIPAPKDECEYAKLTYNGKNVMLLERNGSLLILKDIPTNIRPKLKSGRPLVLAEVSANNAIVRGYTVSLSVDNNVPDKDTLSADFDTDFGFLKEILSEDKYREFKLRAGF